jgi:histone deacetylase complex regulatory component SIN3
MIYSYISIDTPGVIKHIVHIFNGHPSLIQGFNAFLPDGYHIDAHDSNLITTPTCTMMQITDNGSYNARHTSQEFETPDAAADEDESSSAVGM